MANKPIDPTDGMTTYQKFMAGVGYSMVASVQYVGNKVGLVSNETLKETNRISAPLLKTEAGQNGAVLGAFAVAAGATATAAYAVSAGALSAATTAASRIVKMPLNTVKNFVETAKSIPSAARTVAQAVRNAPQTAVKVAQDVRQTAAAVRDNPLQAAKTVGRGIGRVGGKIAKLTTSLAGGALGFQTAMDVKDALASQTETQEGISASSVATGAALVGAAVAGKKIKLLKSMGQAVMSWKNAGLVGRAAAAAVAGATGGLVVMGADEALSTPVASHIVQGMKTGTGVSATLGALSSTIQEYAPHDPYAKLMHEGLSSLKTYRVTLAQIGYAQAQQAKELQQAMIAQNERQEPPAVSKQEPEPARASFNVAAHKQATPSRPAKAYLATAHPQQHAPHRVAPQPPQSWQLAGEPHPTEIPMASEEGYAGQAQNVATQVGGVRNLDTLARALEAMDRQKAPEEPAQVAQFRQRPPAGPA